MIAILLCGGFATRLHPLTKTTPNALLEVAGRPVLDYSMGQLLELPGIEAVHLVTNGRFVAQFYRWHARWRDPLAERGIDFVLHNDGALDETDRQGEVGDLAFVLRRLAAAGKELSEDALVMSGDTIYRFSLRPTVEKFGASERHFVLGVPENHPQVLQQRGVIRFDDDGRLREVFHHPEDPPTSWVCPPLYLLHGSALARVQEYLDESRDRDTMDLFLGYLAEREPVEVQTVPERAWRLRINTRYMYEKANELLAEEPLMIGGLEDAS